jgi:transposase
MRTEGSPIELENRRRLAVQRVLDGNSAQEVADFLGVDPSSVRRWVAAFRDQGLEGLVARPVSGRPPKLTLTQEKIVRRWLFLQRKEFDRLVATPPGLRVGPPGDFVAVDMVLHQ